MKVSSETLKIEDKSKEASIITLKFRKKVQIIDKKYTEMKMNSKNYQKTLQKFSKLVAGTVYLNNVTTKVNMVHSQT